MGFWLFLAFDSKKVQRPRIFSWTFSWMFSHPYSPLTVSECIVSTVVTLVCNFISQIICRSLCIQFGPVFFQKRKYEQRQEICGIGTQYYPIANLIFSHCYKGDKIAGTISQEAGITSKLTWIHSFSSSYRASLISDN